MSTLTRYRAALRAFKARYWADEIARCGSIAAAARENGMNRTHLGEIVRLLGLQTPRKNGARGKWDRPLVNGGFSQQCDGRV